MRIKTILACLLAVTTLAFPEFCRAQSNLKEEAIVIVTDYTYKIGQDDSMEKLKALALFGARHKAAELSAKYLSHKGLLPDYGKKQKEIYCLAADEISADIMEQKSIKNSNSYYVKIQARIKSVDFLRAEIKDLELEKEEMDYSYQEELSQHVYRTIDPAQELSRAYRYLRKGYWRITVIYLNHLKKKYPNWAEMHLVRAIGLYAENKTGAMMNALKTACSLGSREACEDIEGLIHHDKDLKIY